MMISFDGQAKLQVGTDRLRVHDDVGTTDGLPKDDRDTRNCRLAIGIEELRPVSMIAAHLLLRARQETRDVDERHDRYVEGVARPDESGSLLGRGDVQGTGQESRLVGDDADRATVDATEPADEVGRPVGAALEQRAVRVQHVVDDLVDVVGGGRRCRHGRSRPLRTSIRSVGGREPGRQLLVIGRQVLEQAASAVEAAGLVVVQEVAHTRPRRMADGPTEGGLVHDLTGGAGDDRGPVTNMRDRSRSMRTKSVRAGRTPHPRRRDRARC